jgi:hypothetical protein
MKYILRRDWLGTSRYAVITPGFEKRVDPIGAKGYDKEIQNATRFETRELAERWQALLGGGMSRMIVLEVES